MRGSGAIRAQEDTEERVYLPSPFGINTIDPAVALPAGDALYLFNVIAAELGLRSRLGYKEWVTGLGAPVRTTLPFVGSKSNGSTNALFGITSAGIYDCTLSTDTPGAPLVAFGITSGDAGWGTGFNIRNLSGKYLAYTDEENGLFYYPENSPTWLQPVLGVAAVWVQSFNYLVGDQVVKFIRIWPKRNRDSHHRWHGALGLRFATAGERHRPIDCRPTRWTLTRPRETGPRHSVGQSSLVHRKRHHPRLVWNSGRGIRRIHFVRLRRALPSRRRFGGPLLLEL
jgi:hypothetical protein